MTHPTPSAAERSVPLAPSSASSAAAAGPVPIESRGSGEASAAAQSERTKVASAFVICAAIVVQLLVEHYHAPIVAAVPRFVPSTLERLLDGVIVAAVAAFLVETNLFRSYLEERLARIVDGSRKEIIQHTDELALSDFVAKVRDVPYLRTFNRAFLGDAEDAMRRASFAADLPSEVEGIHKALRLVRDQLQVWRTNYEERLFVEAIQGNPTHCRIECHTSWTYVNYSTAPQSTHQVVSEVVMRVPGVADSDLFSLYDVMLGDTKVEPEVVPEELDEFRVRFVAKFPFDLPVMRQPSDGLKMTYTMRVVRPLADPFVVRFFRPIYQMRMTVAAIPGLDLSLHVFGVGSTVEHTDALPCKLCRPPTFVWEYDGWLLPNHGMILSFTVLPPPRVPAIATTPTVPPGMHSNVTNQPLLPPGGGQQPPMA